MPTLKDKIKTIIAARLEKSRDCEFKKAWIPEGWTVVKDEVFADELSDELAQMARPKEGTKAPKSLEELQEFLEKRVWFCRITKKDAAVIMGCFKSLS